MRGRTAQGKYYCQCASFCIISFPRGHLFTETGLEPPEIDVDREARRISSDRSLNAAYSAFFSTPDGRKFARKFGKHYQDPILNGNGNGQEDEFNDPADQSVSSFYDDPIEHIEPEDKHVRLGLGRDEIDKICETFGFSFRWALDGAQSANGDSPIVCIGKRCNVILARMRPDLGAGLTLKPSLCRAYDRRFSELMLLRTGVWFGRALEWMRRGTSLSDRGENVCVVAYYCWSDQINGATLSELAKMTGKTRQALDKLANCFRDTMSNRVQWQVLKSITMRADVTRFRCKNAQFSIL